MKKKFSIVTLLLCLVFITACSTDDGLPSPPVGIIPPKPDPVVVIPPPSAPTFTGFIPQNAFLGDTITITGTNLEANLAQLHLKFGNVATTIVSATPTTARVIVPNDLDTAAVKLSLTSGETVLTSTDDFHLNAPVIDSIDYTKGFAGQFVRIHGKGFRNSFHIDQIAFDGTPIEASLTDVGNTKLFMTIPTNMAQGSYPISVTIAGMTATAPTQFEVVVPTITSITPETGQEFTTMTITGTNLKDIYGIGIDTYVSFRDTAGQASKVGLVLSSEENEITVKVPRLQAGHTYKVAVTVVRSTVTATQLFTYTE